MTFYFFFYLFSMNFVFFRFRALCAAIPANLEHERLPRLESHYVVMIALLAHRCNSPMRQVKETVIKIIFKSQHLNLNFQNLCNDSILRCLFHFALITATNVLTFCYIIFSLPCCVSCRIAFSYFSSCEL